MEDDQRFIGGMRVFRGEPRLPWSAGAMSNATWPLAELRLDRQHVSVRLRNQWLRRRLVRWFPPFEILLDGADITSIGHLPGTRGIIIAGKGDGRDDSAIFWCSKKRQTHLLALFRERGVRIDHAAAPPHRWG